MFVYIIMMFVVAVLVVSITIARNHHKKIKKELRACVVCASMQVDREHEKVKVPGGALGEYWCRTKAHCRTCNARYVEKDWYHYTFNRLRMLLYPSEFRHPSVKDASAVDGVPKFVKREVSK